MDHFQRQFVRNGCPISVAASACVYVYPVLQSEAAMWLSIALFLLYHKSRVWRMQVKHKFTAIMTLFRNVIHIRMRKRTATNKHRNVINLNGCPNELERKTKAIYMTESLWVASIFCAVLVWFFSSSCSTIPICCRFN